METLLERVASLQNLSKALDSLRASSTAAGVDGVTPSRYREGRATHLERLSRELTSNTYFYSKLKAVALPKPDGKHRLLSIPTVQDRVVQKAILNVIQPHIEHEIRSPGSHAYQSQKGIATAVNDLKSHIHSGNHSLVQSDIKKFFDRISAQGAIDTLVERLPDSTLAPLLSQYVGWEIHGLRSMPKSLRDAFPDDGRSTGLPQGTALAPVLSNLILGPLDRSAKANGITLVRYADDVVLLATTRDSALAAFEWYSEELSKLKLDLYNPISEPIKARLIDDIRDTGVEYLGCFISIRNSKCHVKPQEAKIQKAMIHVSEILSARGRSSFPARIIEANAFASAWVNSYRTVCGMKLVEKRVADSAAKSIEELFKAKKIISIGHTLSAEQRAFLGLELRPQRKVTRPTRARVRIPTSRHKRA